MEAILSYRSQSYSNIAGISSDLAPLLPEFQLVQAAPREFIRLSKRRMQ